jgi:hypothetical protein
LAWDSPAKASFRFFSVLVPLSSMLDLLESKCSDGSFPASLTGLE